ncbi:hypothetical protein [Cupriavidus sp. RAF12]|uniref:hypothetical protein n=1 Tax=Cupriavidus sp. RAF12 TaxID=3233050 RepID=UPI003F926357
MRATLATLLKPYRIFPVLLAMCCGAALAQLPPGQPFSLALSPKPPLPIEGLWAQRFKQQQACAARRGDTRTCEALEQRARQLQFDALRRSASPAPVPRPVLPNPFQEQALPIPLPFGG